MQSQTNSLCVYLYRGLWYWLSYCCRPTGSFEEVRCGRTLWSNIVLLEYSEIQYRDGLKRAGDKIGVGLEAHLMN